MRTIQPQDFRIDYLDGFRIFRVSDILSGKNMKEELHRHDFYFILLLTSGVGTQEIDFVVQSVTGDSLIIMRPGQVHRFELKAGCEGYWVAFNKDFQMLTMATGKALLRQAASRNFYKLNKESVEVLGKILQTMLEEYTSKKHGFEFVVKASLEIFLIQFLRYLENARDVSLKVNHYHQEKLQEFLALLESNIGEIKQSAAYADMLNLSPFQLNSITKKLLGKTVTDLIEDQILLEAKRCLLGTTDQVSDIAAQLGYLDASYFIRFFKKRMGVTPEAFRKNFA